MSLINEALKKAQRQRTVAPASDGSGDAGPARPIEKRSAPMRVQTLVMIAMGAGALIIVSVVVTVLWVNRKVEAPLASRPAVTASAKPAASTPEPAPIVVAPLPAPPVATAPAPTQTPVPAAVETTPPAAVATTTPAAAATETPLPPNVQPAVAAASEPAAPVTATPAAEPPPAAAPVARPRPTAHATAAPQDPRVLTFIDAIRVTGIRSSGTESKVLMNDRVYRVNDIVDRTLNLKLVKVEPEALTFADPNGVIYTKTF